MNSIDSQSDFFSAALGFVLLRVTLGGKVSGGASLLGATEKSQNSNHKVIFPCLLPQMAYRLAQI
jgi:hypothetical protein